MPLIKCRECSHEISSRAVNCPQCGHPVHSSRSFAAPVSLNPLIMTRRLGHVGKTILFFIALGLVAGLLPKLLPERPRENRLPSQTQTTEQTSQSKATEVNKQGDTVHVGYTSYAVWKSWWSDRLSANEFLSHRPNAAYLFVDLTVRNDDMKARMVPSLILTDENGAEYEASSHGWATDGAIGILESLNPSVSKQGFVVFDVPRDRQYRLKLSGGYWSAEAAYVQLAPKANR